MSDLLDDAAQESAQQYRGPRMHVGTVTDREVAAHVEGWQAALAYLKQNPLEALQALWETSGRSNASNGDVVIYRDSYDDAVTVFRVDDADKVWRNPEVYRILTPANHSKQEVPDGHHRPDHP